MSNTSIDVAASKAKIRRERRNVEPLEDRVNKLMEEEAKEREKKLEKLDVKIKGITDEDELRSLLKDTDDYYERKRIRTAVRELRRAKDSEIEAYRPTRRASRQHQHDLIENSLNIANVSENTKTVAHIDDSDQKTDKNRMTGTSMIDTCQSITDVSQSGVQNKETIDNLNKVCEDGITSNMSKGEDLHVDSRINMKSKIPPLNEEVRIDEQDKINSGQIIDQEPIDALDKQVNNEQYIGQQLEVAVNELDTGICNVTPDHEGTLQPASDLEVVDHIGDVVTLVPSEHTCGEHSLPVVEDDTQVLAGVELVANDDAENLKLEYKQSDDEMSENGDDEVKMNEGNCDEKMEKDDEMDDVFSIQDENILREKLRETDNFEKKRQIRAAMRELRRKSRENSQTEEEQNEITMNAKSSSNDTVSSTNQNREVESCDQELTTIQIAFEVPETGQQENDPVNSQDDPVNSQDDLVNSLDDLVNSQDDPVNSQGYQDVENTPTAPDIEEITDVDELQILLDDCEDLDERRRIRTALRLLRRRLREEQESIEALDEDITPCVCGHQDEMTADGEEIVELEEVDEVEEVELDEEISECCQTIQIEFEVPPQCDNEEDEVEAEERMAVYPTQFAAFEKAVEGMSSLLQQGLNVQPKITEYESHRQDCDDNVDNEDDDEEEEEEEEIDEKEEVKDEQEVEQPIINSNKKGILSDLFENRPNELSLGYKDTADVDDIIQDIEQSEIVVEPCTDCHRDVMEDAVVEPIVLREDEMEPVEDADNGLTSPVDSGDATPDDRVELATSTCVQIAVNPSKNAVLFQEDTIESSVISLDFERIDDNLDTMPVDVDYSTSEDQRTSDIAMENIVNTPSGRDILKGAMDLENKDSTENVSEFRPDAVASSRTCSNDLVESQEKSFRSDHEVSKVNGETEPRRKLLSKTTLFLNDIKTPVFDKDSSSSSRSSSVVGSRASTPTSTPQSSRSGSICSPNNKVTSMRDKFQFGGLAATTPHNSTSKRDAKIIKGMAGKVSGVAAKFSFEVSTPTKNYSPLVIKSDSKVSRFIEAKNQANSPSTRVHTNKNESSSKSITGLVLSSTPKTRNVLERYKPVQSSIKKDTKQVKIETESSIKKTDCVDKMEELLTPNTKRKSQLKINLNSEDQALPKKLVTIESPISLTKERPSTYMEPISKDTLRINLNSKDQALQKKLVTIESPISSTKERPSYLEHISKDTLKMPLDTNTTMSILSLSTDQNGNPMDISMELDITKLDKSKLITKSETGKDFCDNGNGTNTCIMAPDIEQMENVTELEKMLEVETVFEERKRIRARLRELRKKTTKDVTEQPISDREKRRRERRQETTTNNSQRTSTDDRNNNLNEKESTSPKKVATTITTPTTPVDNKPVLTTPVDNKRALTTPTTPVDNKPPLSPNNNSTAITEVKPETKTIKVNKEKESSEKADDGKTEITTNVKMVEKDGIQSVTKSTVSKSVGGNTKRQIETTEEVVRKDGPCGFSYAKKSTTVSSSSSSSSSSKVPESQPLTSRKMSKFDEELARKKKEREEKRAEDAIKWKEQQASRNKRLQDQRRSDQQAAKSKKANIMQMFGGKVEVGSGSSGPPRMMVQNANSIKAKLLEWCKRITSEYPNVSIDNFSRSWNNGMAFCAIIHHFYPGAFNFDELNPKARRHNFDLAFTTAETLANIMPLLDTEDMIMMKDTPDWKCVFTYVQSLYRNLNGKPVSPSV